MSAEFHIIFHSKHLSDLWQLNVNYVVKETYRLLRGTIDINYPLICEETISEIP